jgi:TonB family protein
MNDSAGAAKVRPPEMAAPPKPADDPGGGGGGGKQEDTPATKGELPPVTTVQLTIPMPVPMNQNPAIAAPPSVVAQNAQPFSFNLPTPDRIGILLGEAQAPPSSGMGRLGGIGDDGDGRGIGNDGGVGVGPGCCMGVSGGPGNSIPEIAGNRSGPGGNPGGRGGINVARGNITEPVPIRQTKPPYSEDARRSRIQGAVVIDVIVQTDGTIDRNSIRLIRGPGYGLNESAIEDIKTWTFKPATENGRPIARAVRIVVDFTLH